VAASYLGSHRKIERVLPQLRVVKPARSFQAGINSSGQIVPAFAIEFELHGMKMT